MTKRHLKARVAPKSWPNVLRKDTKFVAKPRPGSHKSDFSLTLGSIIKDLKLANTSREVKKILNNQEIFVDCKRVKEKKFPVGFMDIIMIKNVGNYRIIIDENGLLKIIDIKKESNLKPSKIINKTMYKGGRLQLNLVDSRNILVKDDKYKTGDSLILELPSQKIIEHLSLKQGSFISLIGGKHIGDIGFVEKISSNNIIYKNKQGTIIETSKEYAFVIKEEFLK